MSDAERALVFALAFAALASAAAAESAPSYISNYSAFQGWLPVIFLAVVLGVMIAAVYYTIGVFLANNKIKSNAISELGQTLGTGIVTVIIVSIFALVGSGQLSLVQLLSPSSIGTVCNQLSASQLDMLNSGGANPSNTICSYVSSLSSGTTGADPTPYIDYGLFYSYVILANLTDQAANNLNAFYLFSGWTGFLSEFTARSTVCTPSPSCLIPGTQKLSFSVALQYKPLAGYSTITNMISSAQFEAVLVFYLMIMQLLFITLFLFIWPYLLAAGIIMQATFFTRKLGGVLIGMSLAAVLVYPVLLGMEYSAFSNLNLGPIGSNNLPAIPLYELPQSGNAIVYGVSTTQSGYVLANTISNSGCPNGDYVYENVCGYSGTITSGCVLQLSGTQELCSGTASSNVNFFILPSATNVLRYYSCMPDSLINDEAYFTSFYLAPGFGLGTALFGSVGSFATGVPTTPLSFWPIGSTQYACTPDRAINAALALANLYGISFVSGVMLPLINVLVALAAMTGFSTLLGGDKDILGLSNLI
jgi:roadblock/LC7 domain-containing protein